MTIRGEVDVERRTSVTVHRRHLGARLLAAALLLILARPADAVLSFTAEQGEFELSCAVFTPDTTQADLIARFGAEHVSTGPVFGFDDGPQQGTILFAERPDSRVEIIWSDPEARRQPSVVMVRGAGSRWRTSNGIMLATDLRALERANGRAFRLAGLQIEGGAGGAVVSWAGGLLEPPSSRQCRNGVHLQPAYDGSEAPALMRQVRSGHQYSSRHPAFHALKLRVVLLTLTFPRPIRGTPRADVAVSSWP